MMILRRTVPQTDKCWPSNRQVLATISDAVDLLDLGRQQGPVGQVT